MIKILSKLFELSVKKNWLNHINRAVDKYNKLNQKANVQAYVVRKLLDRYNELYPNDMIMIKIVSGTKASLKKREEAVNEPD